MFDPDIAYAKFVGGYPFCYLLFDKDGCCLGSQTRWYVEKYSIQIRKDEMGNYNQTKVKIQFGEESMEIEGSPTEVKELSQMFFANVIELNKGKVVISTLPAKPDLVFKHDD